MSKKRTGQIPFDLICRFDVLSKNEIRVVCYLWACRNEITGQCNPKRKTIMNDIDIGKWNLSRTIAGLEDKCWMVEEKSGDFTLFESYQIDNLLAQKSCRINNQNDEESCQFDNQKVVDSTTNENEKLPNQQPKVAESTTKSCRINNKDKKVLNYKGTINGTGDSGKQSLPNILPDRELSPEQKQWFTEGMKFLKEKIGKYPDGSAQGKALKWMLLEGASLDQIKAGLEKQIREFDPVYRVSFLTLQKSIFKYIGTEEANEITTGADQPDEFEDLFPVEEAPIVSPEDAAKWQEILDPIRKKINPQIVQSWFEPIRFGGINHQDKLILLKSTLINKDWVIQYYSDLFCQALEKAGLGEYTFDWKVEAAMFEVGK